MISLTVAEAAAESVVFGGLPAYGFYLLYLSVAESLRSGKVWWFTSGARFKLYRRLEDPPMCWAALSINFLVRFVLCAVPFSLFAFILLPRLIELTQAGSSGQ